MYKGKAEELFKRFFGLNLLTASFAESTHKFLALIKTKNTFSVLPCTLYDLAQVWSNRELQKVYQQIDYCTTDGMPLVWFVRLFNKSIIERVYGPDITRYLLREMTKEKHFFITASEHISDLLRKELIKNYALIKKPKYYVFEKPDTPHKFNLLIKEIIKANPQIIWIGIGSPKQVILASEIKKNIDSGAIFCVGAALEFIANIKPNAPAILQKNGLEWFFRLLSEPRRLWRRYLVDIPFFCISFFIFIIRNRFTLKII